MLVIPSIDLQAGRSRLVFWPGASTGTGTPTDRPDRIARHFVGLGASIIHVVDLDGARTGAPANLTAIGDIARAVATPLQVAGGLDGPEQIEICFAAGATRAVMPLWSVAEDADTLRRCVEIAGDWLAIGLDPRPDRWRSYPWRAYTPPTLDEVVARLVAGGVRRFVLSHGGAAPDLALLGSLVRAHDAEFHVAGGLTDVAAIAPLRDVGVAGILLGEALISGAIDFRAALRTAA